MSDDELDITEDGGLDKASYCIFYKRLVYAFNHDDIDENDLDMHDAIEALETDWYHDSEGGESVDKTNFYDSVFELALVWAIDEDGNGEIDAEEICDYLRDLYPRIFDVKLCT